MTQIRSWTEFCAKLFLLLMAKTEKNQFLILIMLFMVLPLLLLLILLKQIPAHRSYTTRFNVDG